jgi:tripartite ATP-independent transporter DctM subunit
MDPNVIAMTMIAVLLVLLFLGMPIAFATTLAGFGGLVLLLGIKTALASLAVIPFGSLSSYLLTVVPMFILMGQFAFHADISGDLFEVGQRWLSWLPGGLGCGTIMSSALFGACTGSSLACCATMGKIAIPEMEKAGYHPRVAVGTIAGAGGLAILIPPSVPAVLYASVTQESVSKLLIAGIIPGVLSVCILTCLMVVMVKRHPHLAPATAGFPWRKKIRSLLKVWGIILIFILVMGSMYMGWATPTEAGAVGALGVLAAALVRRKSTLRDLSVACIETVRSVAMIFCIFIGTTLFGFFLARAGVPMAMAGVISALPFPPIIIFIAILLFYIPLGMFLDTVSMILLTTPIVYPVITALGFNGIHFGIILIVVCEIGLITPPVAFNLFVVKGVASHISMGDIMRGALPFVFAHLLIVIILMAFPQIVLWLPNSIGGR